MTVRDNQWFVDNMHRQTDFFIAADRLRKEADKLLEKAKEAERDAAALWGDDYFEVFQGHALSVGLLTSPGMQEYITISSLSENREASVFVGEDEENYTMRLSAFDTDVPRLIPESLYSRAGFVVNDSGLSRGELLYLAKSWAANGDSTMIVKLLSSPENSIGAN